MIIIPEHKITVWSENYLAVEMAIEDNSYDGYIVESYTERRQYLLFGPKKFKAILVPGRLFYEKILDECEEDEDYEFADAVQKYIEKKWGKK